MIDPPWPFDLWSVAGEEKSAAAQYTCMTWEQIAALPVGQLMRAGSVAWVWCTWPGIAQQTDIIRAWGIQIKTGGVWAKRTTNGKLRWGTGYMLRTVCEPFLIATIGDSHGFRGRAVTNMIDGLAREHSRKPDEAYQIIEKLMPRATRADVFSRQRRRGWDAWGHEVDKYDGKADFSGSLNECYRAVQERKANGGPGWKPK